MSNYTYKCFNCEKKYPAREIENSFIYLCPECGLTEKNKPLMGVLEIEYDYDALKRNYSKEDVLGKKSGRFWEYPFLWPFKFDEGRIEKVSSPELHKLTLSPSIIDIKVDSKPLKVFDDSRNPTLSYKDRASILIALKALQLGISEISAASTGNAGSSLAGICARLGINAHVFVPKSIPESKKIQIQSFGAELYVVDGDYDMAFDLCLEISTAKKWYNRNTAFNPLTIEGKKSSVFDMYIELKGKLPENIFVSVGDGVIISGIYKGLKDLFKLGWIEKMPKLHAVQAEGSDALVRYLEEGQFNYISASTIADSINAGAPRNLYMAASAVSETCGSATKVSDDEILESQRELASKFGILAEPAASATFAGYKKLLHSGVELSDSMIMITGNGLKDISSLRKWNATSTIYSYEKWIEELI